MILTSHKSDHTPTVMNTNSYRVQGHAQSLICRKHCHRKYKLALTSPAAAAEKVCKSIQTQHISTYSS
jgi:hypothetical protein